MFKQFLDLNNSADWLAAAVAAAGFMLAFLLVRSFVTRRMAAMAATTDTWVDDLIIELVAATRTLLAIGMALYIATHFLKLPPKLEVIADRVFIAVLILQLGLWLHRGMDFWLKYKFGQSDASGSSLMTRSFISFLGRVALWAVVLLLLLDNIGLNVTTLIASLGIGGIAVALAVQNILSDLFASLSIAIDQPFVIGDTIEVDGLIGAVEHVGLKTSRLRGVGGEQIIFSNNDLLKSRIHNYKRMEERRSLRMIGVTYDTPPEKLEIIPQLIRQAIEVQDKVRFGRAHFKAFGPSSLDFEVAYFVLDSDFNLFMDIQQAVNLQIVRSFNDHHIEFAFPTQTLHLANAHELLPQP